MAGVSFFWNNTRSSSASASAVWPSCTIQRDDALAVRSAGRFVSSFRASWTRAIAFMHLLAARRESCDDVACPGPELAFIRLVDSALGLGVLALEIEIGAEVRVRLRVWRNLQRALQQRRRFVRTPELMVGGREVRIRPRMIRALPRIFSNDAIASGVPTRPYRKTPSCQCDSHSFGPASVARREVPLRGRQILRVTARSPSRNSSSQFAGSSVSAFCTPRPRCRPSRRHERGAQRDVRERQLLVAGNRTLGVRERALLPLRIPADVCSFASTPG